MIIFLQKNKNSSKLIKIIIKNNLKMNKFNPEDHQVYLY